MLQPAARTYRALTGEARQSPSRLRPGPPSALIPLNIRREGSRFMGPLAGVKIVEFTGIGPAPMAAMMLADMGATVLRIDRVAAADLGIPVAEHFEFTRRSRAVVHLNLKQPAAIAAALKLIEGADALIEGFRPGVMERLGLGPEICLRLN